MRRPALPAAAVLGALGGCSLSPRYQRPAVPAPPPAYKEAGDWKLATPADTAPRGRVVDDVPGRATSMSSRRR